MRLTKLICGMLMLAGGLLAADPLLGTWKLNLEKSKYGAHPAPKSNTITWTENNGVYHYKAVGVGPDGKPTLVEIDHKFDGKDAKVTGSTLADTVAFTKSGQDSFSATLKKDGKVNGSNKSTLSKDGKTLTTVWNATDASGKAESWTTVNDKQ